MVFNFASGFSKVGPPLKLRKTKNIEVHVYSSIPFIYTFTTIQWYQRPDSFSAFISSVSSTVRLIWDITQIEDISRKLVHSSNRDGNLTPFGSPFRLYKYSPTYTTFVIL